MKRILIVLALAAIFGFSASLIDNAARDIDGILQKHQSEIEKNFKRRNK